MRFLIDECLPPFLGAVLRSAGHDAVAVAALDLCGVPDSIVMATAREQRRVLVSADTDFGEILARSNDRQPSVVLYRGSEVLDAKALGAILLTNLPQIEESLVEGSIVVLLDDRIRVRRLPLGADVAE